MAKARKRKSLTPPAIEKLKPKSSAYLVPDGGSLYLRVGTSGAKSWQFRFRTPIPDNNGRRTMATINIGRYPRVSLKAARIAVAGFKERLGGGVRP